MSWSERLNKVRDGARSLAAGEYGMHDIATSVRAAANNVGGCKDEPYDITKASPELQRAVRLRDERAEERLRHVYGRYFVELDGHPAMFTCFANRIEITPPVAPGLRRGAQLLFGNFSPNNAVPDYEEILLTRTTLKISHPTFVGTVITLHYHGRDHEVRLRLSDAKELIKLIKGHARY